MQSLSQCQKVDTEAEPFQEVDIKSTCLKLFAKIAVRWRSWWSNILAKLQVQTCNFAKIYLYRRVAFITFQQILRTRIMMNCSSECLRAILKDKFVILLDISQNFQKSVIFW